MVQINFISVVRAAVNGERRTEISFNGKLCQLIKHLVSVYGSEFEHRILSDNKIKRYVNVYVNGTDIRFLNELDTRITDADILDFIPSVAGG
ncbi:MAG: MoaD/ThiS family protein [Candidatus Kariarchaeaceae archaeon]|jgi:molybdopterin synthase sulfur carrier subunit